MRHGLICAAVGLALAVGSAQAATDNDKDAQHRHGQGQCPLDARDCFTSPLILTSGASLACAVLASLDSLARSALFSQLADRSCARSAISLTSFPCLVRTSDISRSCFAVAILHANKICQFVPERPGKLGVLWTGARLRLTMWNLCRAFIGFADGRQDAEAGDGL